MDLIPTLSRLLPLIIALFGFRATALHSVELLFSGGVSFSIQYRIPREDWSNLKCMY